MPQGVTSDGTDIWIVDTNGDKVLRYSGAASRTSGNQGASGSFSLAARDPSGITSDGTTIWVVDCGTDRVYKYNASGAPQGDWELIGANSSPTGLTIDPSGASTSVWVVDSNTDTVYEYNRDTGSFIGSFGLAAGNSNPQGIADPPPMLLTSENGSASAMALADGYFAAAAWTTFRPTAIEGARIQRTTRERPSSDVVMNDRLWSMPSADPRTDVGTLERIERQSSAADQALVDLKDHDFLDDDVVADLALTLSKLQ